MTTLAERIEAAFSPYASVTDSVDDGSVLVRWLSGRARVLGDILDSTYTISGYTIQEGSFDVFRVPSEDVPGQLDRKMRPSESTPPVFLLAEAAHRANHAPDPLDLIILRRSDVEVTFVFRKKRIRVSVIDPPRTSRDRESESEWEYQIAACMAGSKPYISPEVSGPLSRSATVQALVRHLNS